MTRLVTLALFIASTAASAQTPDPVQTAFDAMTASKDQQWAYTRTRSEPDEVRIEKFDPASDPEWTLLSVNGQAPSEKQRRRYAKTIESRATEDKSEFDDLAQDGSWQLLDETDKQWRYGFKPKPEADDPQQATDALNGELVVNKAGPFVQTMRIWSDRPFKPAAVAKVLELRMQIDFDEIAEGVYRPVSSSSYARAKVMLMTKVQNQNDRFTDYYLVGE